MTSFQKYGGVSITVIGHINDIKDRGHTTISIDAEKNFLTKTCATSLAIREGELKLYWNSLSSLLEWQSSRKQRAVNAAEDVNKGDKSLTGGWWESKLVQPLWKLVWELLKTGKNWMSTTRSSYSFLNVFPKNSQLNLLQRYLAMFTAILFTITKLWSQTRCPIGEGQVRNMLHLIYTMEYFSAIKSKIMTFSGNQVQLERIVLS